jgi:threonine synthase
VVPPIGSNPFGVEGYKTIAYEIAEDLDWTAPDVVAVPSCYSDGLFGIWKGWAELHALGLVKARPRMLAAEPFGPLAHAQARQLEAPEKVASGTSVAYQGLVALRESGGIGVPITDEGIFEAQRALAGEEGLYAEPSAIVGLTAVMQLARTGRLDPGQLIVVVLTSGGLKDYGSSRTWLPPVPSAGPDFDSTVGILEDSYGVRLT